MSVGNEIVEELRNQYVECQLKSAKLNDQIAELRKKLSKSVSHADDLLAQIRHYEEEQVEDEKPVEGSSEAAGDSSEEQSTPVVPSVSVYAVNANIAMVPPPRSENTSDAWKQTPITVLRLAEIDGLGPQKRARLIDAVPTMGDLEAVRGEASLKCVPFASLLPKGIGQATADEIEERMLNWLRDHQGRMGVTESTGEHKSEPPPELETIPDIRLKTGSAIQTRRMGRDYLSPPPTPEDVVNRVSELWTAGPQVMPEGVVIEPEPSGGKVEPEVDAEVDMEPEDSIEYLRHRYGKMLRRSAAEELKLSIAVSGSRSSTYEDGREAARRGFTLEDCNWAPGENQDQWLLGFIAGDGKPEHREVAESGE